MDLKAGIINRLWQRLSADDQEIFKTRLGDADQLLSLQEPTYEASPGEEDHQSDGQNSILSWPPDLREAFEERAAILEFDGGLSRTQAEKMAVELIQRRKI